MVGGAVEWLRDVDADTVVEAGRGAAGRALLAMRARVPPAALALVPLLLYNPYYHQYVNIMVTRPL